MSPEKTVISILGSSFYRPTALRSIVSIFRNFFLLQYKAALLPGRYRISQVDHPLDEKIPFRPGKVEIYLDFLHFFIRTLGFLLRAFGARARREIRELIAALGAAYTKAAEVYARNFSTTHRPRYLAKLKFLVIHAFDPHLMCVPSLHVMVVILAFTGMRKILRGLDAETKFAPQLEETRNHALAITEAVLYVKQHSVNCIPAAMYALGRLDDTFTRNDAEAFTGDLFQNADDISGDDVRAIRSHILDLYQRFCAEGTESAAWEKPLLNFLKTLPEKTGSRH